MKLPRLFFSLILIVCSSVLHAGNVTIHGMAADYAGVKIIFYTLGDLITNTEDTLAQTTVSPEGRFSCTFNIKETLQVFSHLGVYKAGMFVEPGNDYEVTLPPRKDKSEADMLNPFFEEYSIGLVIRNKSNEDINQQIRMFNDAYVPYYNKYAENLQSMSKPVALDSSISEIMGSFRDIRNVFFNQYCTYKIGLLRHMAYQFRARAASEMYFANRPLLYHNPAYMELFNQVFDKYFIYFSHTPEGSKILNDVNRQKSLAALKQTLGIDSVLRNEALKELVILKNLYDEFYSDHFSRSAILVLLDSVYSTTLIPEHRLIAGNIRKQITRLMPGYDPPPFTLLNRDSVAVSLDSFKGRYVYLGFCSCFSYSCLREFEMLQKMYNKLNKYVEIITVSVDENLGQMRNFLSKNNYNWVFLHFGNQPGILKDYDIRGYPTYFLIDRQGKLILSPAPSPFENIESRMFEIMREKGDLQ